jgi:hypothetical protein
LLTFDGRTLVHGPFDGEFVVCDLTDRTLARKVRIDALEVTCVSVDGRLLGTPRIPSFWNAIPMRAASSQLARRFRASSPKVIRSKRLLKTRAMRSAAIWKAWKRMGYLSPKSVSQSFLPLRSTSSAKVRPITKNSLTSMATLFCGKAGGTFFDQPVRLALVEPTVQRAPLSFEFLVLAEEMFDLLPKVIVESVEGLDRGRPWVVFGDSYDLPILPCLVFHIDRADRAHGHDAAREEWCRDDNEDIEMITVLAPGLRDEAVVERIVNWRMEDAIEADFVESFVVLELIGASFGDFDNDIDGLRRLRAERYGVKTHEG